MTPDQAAIPERLHRLPELANDLWWTWNTSPREVFRRLDYPLWRQTAHNPVLMLRLISQRDDRGAAADPAFLALYDAAIAALDQQRSAPRDTWWSTPLRAYATVRSPTSPPSSRCISRCRSTPAAWACSPAITARKPATSACR